MSEKNRYQVSARKKLMGRRDNDDDDSNNRGVKGSVNLQYSGPGNKPVRRPSSGEHGVSGRISRDLYSGRTGPSLNARHENKYQSTSRGSNYGGSGGPSEESQKGSGGYRTPGYATPRTGGSVNLGRRNIRSRDDSQIDDRRMGPSTTASRSASEQNARQRGRNTREYLENPIAQEKRAQLDAMYQKSYRGLAKKLGQGARSDKGRPKGYRKPE